MDLQRSAADSVTPTTLITRADIDETPGASRTIGMEMITDYVPGAYMTHDMLHMRGGHQTSWLIDGIAIPNTKIASNVGPQIDPKDIDSLETQRGSYASDVGDRTYGVFNVLPRNGFERSRDGELLALRRQFLHRRDSALARRPLASRLPGTQASPALVPTTAWRRPLPPSITTPPTPKAALCRSSAIRRPRDQLRLNAQYRQDHFQVPYDPDPNDWEQRVGYY